MNLLMFNLATDANDSNLWFSVDWATRLSRRFRSITIVTMRAGHYALPSNVRVYSIGKERGYSEPRRVLVFYWHLSRILLTQRIDVCFAHQQPLFALLASPLFLCAGVRTVLWYAHGRVSKTLRVAEKVVCAIVTSSALGCRLSSPKIRVIGQGIDVDRFRPDAHKPNGGLPHQFRILSLGRLSPIKNSEDLITAFAAFTRTHPDQSSHLRIVGDIGRPEEASYRQSLFDLVSELGLSESVTFVGPIPSHAVPNEYREADLVVSLTERAAMDKVVLEAMSTGTPVLCANDAYTNVLSQLDDHLVLRQHDTAQLAERLAWYLRTDPAFRADLSQRLRDYVVREHSVNQLIDRVVGELQRCAS